MTDRIPITVNGTINQTPFRKERANVGFNIMKIETYEKARSVVELLGDTEVSKQGIERPVERDVRAKVIAGLISAGMEPTTATRCVMGGDHRDGWRALAEAFAVLEAMGGVSLSPFIVEAHGGIKLAPRDGACAIIFQILMDEGPKGGSHQWHFSVVIAEVEIWRGHYSNKSWLE